MSLSTDYWRKFFRSSKSNIFEVIDNAILVAAADHRNEFASRRNQILETIYTCRSSRCSSCNGVEAEHLVHSCVQENDGSKTKCHEEIKIASFIDEQGTRNKPDELKHIVGKEPSDELKEEKRVIDEVMAIKELLKHKEEESDHILIESLRQLQSMKLSANMIQVTKIRSAVKHLRKNKSKKIRRLVKALANGWKIIVDEWARGTAPTTSVTLNSAAHPPHTEVQWLGFPPVDEGVLFAAKANSIELSKISDEIDDDGHDEDDDDGSKFSLSHKWQPPTNGGDIQVKLQEVNRERSKCIERPRETKEEHVHAQLQVNGHHHISPHIADPGTSSGPLTRVLKFSHGMSLESDKLEAAKRKLHERYQQAENAKRQRRIQIMELHELPMPAKQRR